MYIPIRFFKRLLQLDILTEWQTHWASSAKGRAVFEIFDKVNPKRTLGSFFLNQIITGHGAIASYQYKFFNGSSTCSCGPSIEDRNHILFHYSNWTDIKKKYFPRNYKRSPLAKLLGNHQARIGIELIMKHKLQTILDGLSD
ncbi:RNase H domain-containing protein [Caerostris extrusa]|uniref:RNase H domain-containing protein n=1 Tax=Caerostris extrusa TaxID=172846 RepID=A0AAV4TTP1_CAEEX|nr:RNase H domain-containing protein [Caerostris extrusa]